MPSFHRNDRAAAFLAGESIAMNDAERTRRASIGSTLALFALAAALDGCSANAGPSAAPGTDSVPNKVASPGSGNAGSGGAAKTPSSSGGFPSPGTTNGAGAILNLGSGGMTGTAGAGTGGVTTTTSDGHVGPPMVLKC